MQRLITQSLQSVAVPAEVLSRMMTPTSSLNLRTLLISRSKTSVSSDEDPVKSSGSDADDSGVYETSSSDENDQTPPLDGQEPSPGASTSAADAASGSAAAAGEAATAAATRGHVSLDDPVLNIYLRHNTKFVTDPDRGYLVGQATAYEKKARLELLKALAAHRLQLKDAQAAAAAEGRQEPSLHQQMTQRLAEMQHYWADKAQ